MAKQIEAQHEVKVGRRIADVRPWREKMQERLSDPVEFLFFAIPLLVSIWIFPILFPVGMALFVAAHFSVMNIKSLLPYRYPASLGHSPEPKKKADGILFVGSVRADSPYEKFKQCWLNDSDLRKHWLIIGSTGSGKSETLKGIFYNTLCWGSGFFCADGKADNKLPTDGYTMARAFGRDDDILALNFLLGGKTPQQVANSRKRRSNGLNPFSSGDADTLIQMGANLLPKAEGEGKSWQEKALVVWRAVVTALCYKRDTHGFTLSIGTIIDYLSLSKIEELYVEGYKEARDSEHGDWSYGFASIKNYLESGCPAYSVEKLLKKHNLEGDTTPRYDRNGNPMKAGGRETEQDPAALEQHGYRTGQLMPVLNLLDKTYGHIFRAPFSEIDMIDVALHNRILFLLIPSLEKSSQEAENLGKLAIACLRVMMARNLGAELEGSRQELIDSKATKAAYPYVVALDELAYYFADGIAVMFAQARTLGICMLAATQDLEKLTEGSRAAEAGAMIGNTVNKIFMKIDDPEKTYKLVSNTVGKIQVANYDSYEAGDSPGGYKRNFGLRVSEAEMITYGEMQKYTEGQAIMNALGVTQRISTFYMGDWLDKLNNKNFHINRFLQVHEPSDKDIEEHTRPVPTLKANRTLDNGRMLMEKLRAGKPLPPMPAVPVFSELARVIAILNKEAAGINPMERGAVLYLALKNQIKNGNAAISPAVEASPGVDIPASAGILAPDRSKNLIQALDEHGLPDPLSLLRKPLMQILSPVQEAPEPAKPARPSHIKFPDAPRAPMWEGFGRDGDEMARIGGEEYDGFSDDAATASSHIDDVLTHGRPATRPLSPAAWVSHAVADAHAMFDKPRSPDKTAIGFSDDTVRELEKLEKELGSSTPKHSAHTMQKVVAANVTPSTTGEGNISDEQIEAFFSGLMGDNATASQPLNQ